MLHTELVGALLECELTWVSQLILLTPSHAQHVIWLADNNHTQQ